MLLFLTLIALGLSVVYNYFWHRSTWSVGMLTQVVTGSSWSWAVFKIVAASLKARSAFKIVACFLYHTNSKVCLQEQ